MIWLDCSIRCPDVHLIASVAIGKVLEASGEIELQLAGIGVVGNGKLGQDVATDSTGCIMVHVETGCVPCRFLEDGSANGD